MTAERVKQSLKSWIESQYQNHPALIGIPIVLNGESDDVEMPVIGIIDTASSNIEQDGVVMRGVDQLSINVEMHTVPRDNEDFGTTIIDHSQIAEDLYNILDDGHCKDFCDGFNGATIFDIRVASPIIEMRDGRRVSVFQMTVIACPL